VVWGEAKEGGVWPSGDGRGIVFVEELEGGGFGVEGALAAGRISDCHFRLPDNLQRSFLPRGSCLGKGMSGRKGAGGESFSLRGRWVMRGLPAHFGAF